MKNNQEENKSKPRPSIGLQKLSRREAEEGMFLESEKSSHQAGISKRVGKQKLETFKSIDRKRLDELKIQRS